MPRRRRRPRPPRMASAGSRARGRPRGGGRRRRRRGRAAAPPAPPPGEDGRAGRDGGEDEEAEAGLGSGSGGFGDRRVALRGRAGWPVVLRLGRRPASRLERKTSPSPQTRLRLSPKPLCLPVHLNVPPGRGDFCTGSCDRGNPVQFTHSTSRNLYRVRRQGGSLYNFPTPGAGICTGWLARGVRVQFPSPPCPFPQTRLRLSPQPLRLSLSPHVPQGRGWGARPKPPPPPA
jgi:hypothetical protein